MLAGALVGLLGAAWVTSVIRARIHRLEPEQITALVKSHPTTMHRLSEGVIAIDEDGVDGARAEATPLLRDHTELHDVVRRVDAADAVIAFRQRAGVPKGLSTETLDRVVRTESLTPTRSSWCP